MPIFLPHWGHGSSGLLLWNDKFVIDFFSLLFETGCYSNSRYSCLSLLSDGIIGMNYHSQPFATV
jgi:hypothetical protein